jgi:hypothetical protein
MIFAFPSSPHCPPTTNVTGMFLFPKTRVEWCGNAAQKNPPEE